jgi:hypothetical protein
VGLLFACSCAGTYKPINPRILNYNYTESSNGVSMSYQYDMLQVRRNKRYAKKEDKKNLRVVAVKVTNHTDSVLSFSNDLTWHLGGRETIPVDPLVVGKKIKQTVPTYLLLSLLNIRITETEMTSRGPVTKTTAFLPTGFLMAGGNMIVAGTANANFRRELNLYNLAGQKVSPGETKYGIVTFETLGREPVELRIKSRAVAQN